MTKPAAKDQFEYSIATARPTPRQRQFAFVVIVVTLGAFGAAIPFANIPLQQFDSFVPATMAVVFVTDLVTAVLLFGQFSATGSRALLMLASGYLFSSLMAIPHALTFPGAFTPTGLLGAGPQSSAWLNVSWRFGLSLALLGYALLISGKHTKHASEPVPHAAIVWSVAIVIVVVGTLTWAVTAGGGLLPSLLVDGKVSPFGHAIQGIIVLASMLAFLLLWIRGRSVLDLWLMVAACELLGTSLMIAFFVTARFTFGFYAMRITSLVVSKAVLIVLKSSKRAHHVCKASESGRDIEATALRLRAINRHPSDDPLVSYAESPHCRSQTSFSEFCL